MSPTYRGRVISVETNLATDMRGQNHVWAAQAVIIVWSFFAGFGMIAGASAGTQLVLILVFGGVALYIYTVGKRSGPTVVYENGIEHSTGLSRRFNPWHRLMYG